MSPKQIDAKYDRFLIVFTRDGVESQNQIERIAKFKAVKAEAVSMLSDRLDQAHGRGDHCVKVFGMVLVNTTSEQDAKVGFPPNLTWTKDEELFTL
jgi:hypothetical protein